MNNFINFLELKCFPKKFKFLLDWNKEEHKFCRRCSTFYDTFEEAKSACIDDLNCEAVYDLFCDGDGSFCTCNALSVIEQPHPKGMDCIYRKPRVP